MKNNGTYNGYLYYEKNNYYMFNKTFKDKVLKKQSLETVKQTEYCKVSQASNEIMLDRFYNGKGIEFPFAQ